MIAIDRIEPSDIVAPLLSEYLGWHAADVAMTTGIRISPAEELAGDLGTLGQFVPPAGALFIAREGERLVGCVGVRSVAGAPGEVAEIKRLYVRPEARGKSVARRLLSSALDFAREANFQTVRLDTFATMTAAQTLYRDLGFRDTTPFPDTSIPERQRRHFLFMTRAV
jgi:ribosomal protein S18 acetylase RimI-like enzyme